MPFPALPHPGLGRQVKHVRHAVQQRRQVGVGEGRLDETEGRGAVEPSQIPFLCRSRIEVGERVDADDGGTVCNEAVGKMGPDKAGSTGDERLHASRSRTWEGSRRGLPLGSTAACIVCPKAATVSWPPRVTS